MANGIRFLLAPALFSGILSFAHAQEPAANERTAGKVLLLKNGNIMEGEITKTGTQMCIRRGTSEVWVGLDKTARLCADWDDAYVYMLTQINLEDANDRMALARWCKLHHLTDQALFQAKDALKLQPKHREAKEFVALLERTQEQPAAAPVTPAAPVAPMPVKTPQLTPNIDVVTDTLVSYSLRVQPILMNTCVNCHGADFPGEFKLERVFDGSQKFATRRNLNVVLGLFDLEHIDDSPLLVKAVEVHGNAPLSPIKDRNAKPFQTLEQWIEQTIARNPQLKAYYAATKPGRSKVEVKVAASSPFGEDRVARTAPAPKTPLAAAVTKSSLQTGQSEYWTARQVAVGTPLQKNAPQPTNAAAPGSDPFDPDVFNRLAHPTGPSWQAAALDASRNR